MEKAGGSIGVPAGCFGGRLYIGVKQNGGLFYMNRIASQGQRNTGRQNGERARMLIACPDQPGIVAAVSRFLHEHGANIVQSDQYTMDPEGGMFFIRIEFDLNDLDRRLESLKLDFAQVVADKFQMDWSVSEASQIK